MKAITFLFVIAALSALAHAQVNPESVRVGPYAIDTVTNPATLEPGNALITLHVQHGDDAVPHKQVWLQLRDASSTLFAGSFITDSGGNIPFTYSFNGPGSYSLDIEIDGARATVPLQVHGQYLLLFGFLAAIFIVVALLLEKI